MQWGGESERGPPSWWAVLQYTLVFIIIINNYSPLNILNQQINIFYVVEPERLQYELDIFL
jgi:hypothetical protein